MKVKSTRNLLIGNRKMLTIGQILVGELEDFPVVVQRLLNEKSYLLEVLEEVKPEPKAIVVKEVKPEPKPKSKKVAKAKKLIKKKE